MAVGLMVVPGTSAAQASGGDDGSFWVTPYLGIGVQSEYHDAIVEFVDGDLELLRLEPGSALVYGVQAGVRAGTAWTVQANLSTSSPEAEYVEDNNIRPNVDLKTTQFELGALYDLAMLTVGDGTAPLMIGGGLSLMSHSFDPFLWSDTPIEPSSTSFGLHGLAALDVPVSGTVSLRGQTKLTGAWLSLDDLNDKIGLAEGDAVAIPLDGGFSTYFLVSVGLTFRL